MPNLPSSATCTDCSKQIFITLEQEFPGVMGSDAESSLNQMCGANFTGEFASAYCARNENLIMLPARWSKSVRRPSNGEWSGTVLEHLRLFGQW